MDEQSLDQELDGKWAHYVAQMWARDWSDPREDIYTLEDGQPVSDEMQHDWNRTQ
jgi:hypothetical protein